MTVIFLFFIGRRYLRKILVIEWNDVLQNLTYELFLKNNGTSVTDNLFSIPLNKTTRSDLSIIMGFLILLYHAIMPL